MANLLGWLGNLPNRAVNTIQHDIVQPYQRDIVPTLQHPTSAPLVGGLINAGSSAITAPTNLIRLGAADASNNNLARQNALQALLPALHTAQSIARTVPETLNTVGHPFTQHTYQPTGIAAKAFGSTPVQNIQKKVANNYNTHPNLNPFLRVGLAGLEGAGSVLQDAPVAGGTLKLAKGASKLDKTISTAIPATKKLGVGNLGMSTKNISPAQGLTRQEMTAGRALGMSDAKTLQAKQSIGLQKAFSNTMDSMSPEEKAALSSNEQMAVSGVLKHMGEQKNPVPSVKGVSELPPVKPVSAFTELLSPKTSVLDKMGGSGTKIAGAIRNIEADKSTMRSDWMSQIPTFQKLSKADAAKAWDIKEGTVAAKGASPKILQAVKELQAVTPQVHKAGFDQGAIIGNRGVTYMPHSYDFKALAKGSKYDAALQHLMDTQQVDHKTATQLFKDMASENAGRPNRFGNFENARLTDMPGYSKSKQAFYDYLQGAATKVAETKHFGLDNQIVQKNLDNLRMEGGDTNIAAKTVENYLRSQDRGRGAGSLRSTRALFAAGSLSKAAISHAGQLSNTAVEAGIGKTLKNTAIRASGGEKELIRKSGVTNPQELHAYREQYTAAGKALSKVTAPGLNSVMKFNRGSSALTGPDFANSLLKKGNVAKVRSLGVTGKLGTKLTPAQEIQAARGLTKDTMFGASRAETPLHAETKTGKLVGQFRTAYAYRQARFIKDQVINEARKGNYMPALRYGTLSAGVGYGTVAAKNKISGTNQGPGGRALDTAAALGGIPGELLVQAARYGPRDVTKFVAGQVAPLAGEAVTTAENVQKALGKNHPLAPLERQVLGHIPLVGGRVSKAALPSKTAATATAQNQTASPNIQTETAFRASKPQGQTLQQVINSKGEKTYAYSLSDGSIATSKDKKTAQTAIQKDTFTQSGQNFQQLGKNIWQLDSNGNPTHTTVPVYQYSVNSATLTSQKDAGDIQGWLGTANKQLQNIQGQLKDPSTAPLKALQLQNDASTLQSEIAKYTGYGGFTKPKAPKKAKAPAIASFKTASSAKGIAKPKGVSVRKLAAPSFKAPKTTKLSVSKIPVVTNRRKA